MQMLNLEAELSKVASVAIAGHIRPDGDCVGSCMGLYLYIKDNFPAVKRLDVFLERIPPSMEFIQGTEAIKHDFLDEAPYELFISLDSGDTGRLGAAAKYLDMAARTVCIDHHISNKGYADENYIVPDASSTSELLYTLRRRFPCPWPKPFIWGLSTTPVRSSIPAVLRKPWKSPGS